ncbi:hypothetical protein Hanom_Chr16g01452611 [Helianthus anomalus]
MLKRMRFMFGSGGCFNRFALESARVNLVNIKSMTRFRVSDSAGSGQQFWLTRSNISTWST